MSPKRPGMLLLAIWFGLTTGLAEVALLGVKKFYLERAIRFGPAITWMAPLADLLAFLLIGVLIVAVQRVGRRFTPLASPAFAVSVFAFFSALSLLLMYYPLHLYAKLLLAAGIGVQVGRISGRWPAAFERLLRTTVLWLAPVVVVLSVAVAWRSSAALGRYTDAPAPTGQRPNVLLIVLDTVRAKNMSVYGYNRATTPNLEHWAKSGVVFDRATATSPWTLPSHGSMFTGRWSSEMSATLEIPLDDTHPTVAGALQGSGYATAGFVANTNYCGYEFGLSRGFAHYEDYNPSPGELLISSTLVRSVVNNGAVRRVSGYYDYIPRKSAETITNDFLDWLPEASGRPFFAFLNYFDAHEAYLPPSTFAHAFGPEAPRRNHMLKQETRRNLRFDWPERPASEIKAELDMYDASIAYLDSELSRLFGELRSRGLLESTLIIVTSDHGEQFGEHGLFLHGNSLYEPLLRVPLIVRYPPGIPGGRRVATRTSLRDIPATILDVTGIEVAPQFPGSSLARYWAATPPSGGSDAVLAEVEQADFGKDWYPLRGETWRR